MSQEVDLTHIQKPVPCDACEDEVPGTYYCIPCKKTLCEDCDKSHRTSTDDHKVILRSQVGEIDPSIPTCADHGDDACFHCEKCNVPICIKCVIGNHQGHKRTYLNVLMEKKELLQGNIEEIQSTVMPELIRHEEANETERHNYNKRIEQLKKDMEDSNKVLHQVLDRIHQDRMKSLKDTQLNQLTLFDDRAAEIRMIKDLCKSKESEYQDALKKNQIEAINDLLERKKNLPEVQSKIEILAIPSFERPNIYRIIENLGQLQILYHTIMQNPIVISKFKCPLKGYPRIYTTKEGNIWLGGNEAKKLVNVDIKGQVLKERKIRTAPYTLAQMDSGDLIYIPQNHGDFPVIKVTADDNEHDLFDPLPFKSHGIFVTVDQKLLICTTDGRVMRTNSDGTDIKQIYKGSGLHSAKYAIENAYGDIYISDYSNTALVIISKDGTVRSTITHTTNGEAVSHPVGLVADRIGNILCADLDSHCVYIIDQNLKMTQLLGRSHGIKFPTWLAVDGKNNLWLTQKDGSILVVKYMG